MKAKSLLTVIFILAIASLGPGLWKVSESQEKATKKEDMNGTQVRVIEEEGPAGHQTIGIDEGTTLQGVQEELLLRFSTLMTWNYRPEDNSPPPEKIKKLHGRTLRLTGFMFPLQEGKSIQYFCLLRTTQTCCYGPRPQYNQYVFVEMAKPTEFHRLAPISCVGTFKVEPTPQEGFIYRLEGKSCESLSKK